MVPVHEKVHGKYAKFRIQSRNWRLKSAKAVRQTELRKQKDAVLEGGAALIKEIMRRKTRGQREKDGD